MTMIPDAYLMIAAAALGLALGVFYFGGLWMTVRKMTVSKNPKTLMVASYLIRLGVALLAFWLILQQGAAAFCIAFGIFAATRFAIQKWVVRRAPLN